jgi:hypothetical protein
MKDLFKLLERFTNSLNKDEVTRQMVATVISDRIGVPFNPENVSIKNGVLQLSSSPALNNEIRLKEDSIRQELKETRNINILRVLYK